MLNEIKTFFRNETLKRGKELALIEFLRGTFALSISQLDGKKVRLLEIECLSRMTGLFQVDMSTIDEADFTAGQLFKKSSLYTRVAFLNRHVGQLMGEDPYFVLMPAPELLTIYFEDKPYQRIDPGSNPPKLGFDIFDV